VDRLDTSVRSALRGAGVPDAAAIAAIVEVWPAAVGTAIARSAWPLRLGRLGTLHVACVSSTWAFELGRMAPELVDALRAQLGDGAPAELRFAPGPVPAAGPEPAGERPAAVDPAPDEVTLAAELASSVDDPELRELVARAAAASLARARHNRRF
jgi:hypothetical protein